MAIKTKKQETKKQETKKRETQRESHDITVDRVRNFDDAISLQLTINGVTIYGAWYRTYTDKNTGEERNFIAFPSRKADNGKYYSHCYCPLSDDDISNIEWQIEALINAE